MKHYTLMKLKPGADAEKVQLRILKAYEKLDAEMDWANRPVVFRRCVEEGSDMDIMAVIEIDSAEQLAAFLEHPIRISLAEKLEDDIADAIVFNHY